MTNALAQFIQIKLSGNLVKVGCSESTNLNMIGFYFHFLSRQDLQDYQDSSDSRFPEETRNSRSASRVGFNTSFRNHDGIRFEQLAGGS